VPTRAGGALEPDPDFLRARLSESLDRYTPPIDSKKKIATAANLDAWLPDSVQTDWSDIGHSPTASWLFANTAVVLKDVLPFPEAVRAPDVVRGSWSWVEGKWAGQPVLEMRPPKPDPQDPREEDDRARHQKVQQPTASDFPIANVLASFRHQNNCGVLLLGLVASLFWFTRYTVLRRFGLDFRPTGDPIPEASLAVLAGNRTSNILALDFPRCIDAQALSEFNQSETIQVFPLQSLLPQPG
jgi:hypothetical protein